MEVIDLFPSECPLCKSDVRLFYISFHEMILICVNTLCAYPFSEDTIVFVQCPIMLPPDICVFKDDQDNDLEGEDIEQEIQKHIADIELLKKAISDMTLKDAEDLNIKNEELIIDQKNLQELSAAEKLKSEEVIDEKKE